MRVSDECISPYVGVHTYFIYKNNCDDWSQSLLCVQINAGDFSDLLVLLLQSVYLQTQNHCVALFTLLHCRNVLV